MTNDRYRSEGFSLIELLVVLTLLAIIAGVAVPLAFSGFGGVQVQSAARRMAATMRLAHDSAVSSRTEHSMTFDASNSTYRVVKGNDSDRRLFDPDATDDDEEEVENSERRIVANEILPEGITFLDLQGGETDTLPTLSFAPQGHSSGGEIVLGDAKRALRVIVERPASRIRVEAGDRDDWD